MKLLAFAASLRKASLHKKLIRVAVERARAHGAEVDLADFHEFDMPLYDGDLQEQGWPRGAEDLARRVRDSNGILLAAPEYNYSIAGPLKNAIDWISRIKPYPTLGKPVLLLGTSTGSIGGYRGLWQTRIPLEGCGAHVFPEMFGLPFGPTALGDDGLTDPKQSERLDKLMQAFLQFASKLM
jgi:NAD(P)H-dependent FMN reductase